MVYLVPFDAFDNVAGAWITAYILSANLRSRCVCVYIVGDGKRKRRGGGMERQKQRVRE